MYEEHKNTAQITGRVLIVGDLVLDAPLLIGAGDGGDDRGADEDIRVLKGKEGPFIPGTSLCGVLREFLRTHEDGKNAVKTLFGEMDEGQSMIAVDDVPLSDAKIVTRDGVGIDGVTGVGVDGAKYDYEAVERGAHGKFRLLVTRRLCHEGDWAGIYDNLLLLREKMEDGLSLGAITAKGFGKVHAENVQSGFYDFHKKEDVLAWLEQEDPMPEKASDRMTGKSGKSLAVAEELVVEADFALRGSVIVRDYGRQKAVPGQDNKMYDAVSIMSGSRYVLPGTSLKGVLRHQAEHILRRLGVDGSFLKDLMGFSENDDKKKSRFQVEEGLLQNIREAGQTRVRIDRFTGGALESALFDNEPLWQEKDDSAFQLRFRIKNAQPKEIGLALFLLRDLWQGRVAVGGEKSVGRGVLRGMGGVIRYGAKTYCLDKNGNPSEGRKELQEYVDELLKDAKKEAIQ